MFQAGGTLRLFIYVSIAVFSSPRAFGLGGVTFGPEFTFAHVGEDVKTWQSVKDRMYRHLVTNQPNGAKFKYSLTDEGMRMKLISPNRWWLTISDDLGGVAEAQMKPATVGEFKKYKSDMQDAIFASAANEEFFPAMFLGGGHINIGLQALKSRPLLLRNFIVDLFNHNELFLGIFNYDTNNALSFSLMSEDGRDEIRRRIREFDKGEMRNIFDLLEALFEVQKRCDDKFCSTWTFSDRADKSYAVNFSHAKNRNSGRIELRGVRPQLSMEMFVRQIDLFQHRIDYLEKIKTPIPVKPIVPIQAIDLEQHWLNPPVNPQLALRAFYQYVSESGMSWQDHRDYIWPKWITDGELTKFEKSDWFLQQQKKHNICERVLAA